MYTLYNNLIEDIKKEEYARGRADGFKAGYAAAQQQPAEKIQHAYNQGVSNTLKKNGVGY